MFGFAAVGYSPLLTRNTKSPALELEILSKFVRGFLKLFSIFHNFKTPSIGSAVQKADYELICCVSLWYFVLAPPEHLWVTPPTFY